ncbi:lysozyme inhibitor LprI family protein [Shimia sp.]|uniref:lysozyme inhibitor LprI family protein n=1 Tax=Shimia sp. TaxID=1954381 RepID=UPI003B8ABFB2
MSKANCLLRKTLTATCVVFCITTTEAIGQETLYVDEVKVITCATSASPMTCVGNEANHCQRLHEDGFDGGTTQGISRCIDQETLIWGEILVKREMGLLKQLSERDSTSFAQIVSRVESFKEAQDVWLAYQDAECRLRYALTQEGTIRFNTLSSCKLTLTAARVAYLNELASN